MSPAVVTGASPSSQGHQLVDAVTALGILRVKPQTLYAYVSRGMVRVSPTGASRGSLYYKDDVDAIASRSRKKREGPAPGERNLRRGGAAVLQTAISYLGEEGPVYRGYGAVDLARQGRAFEEVASLLWDGALPQAAPIWPAESVLRFFASNRAALRRMGRTSNARQRQNLTLAAYAASWGADPESAIGATSLAAQQSIQALAAAFALLVPEAVASPAQAHDGVAGIVARSAGLEASPVVLAALNAAMIVCAEHELAAATFVARIAASAGSDIFSCIGSALGTFEGQSAGSGCDACETLLHRAASPSDYLSMLQAQARQRRGIAGYNHAAYPRGDPRGPFLLMLAGSLPGVRSKTKSKADAARQLACVSAASDELHLAPSVIAGLVVLCTALGLPPGSAGALMSLGRAAGWVAHSVEQRSSGFALRPRAQYTGEADRVAQQARR